MEIIREAVLVDVNDNDEFYDTKIPIKLGKDGENFTIIVDGVEWLTVNNQIHAVVLFDMMKENLTEYMYYEEV